MPILMTSFFLFGPLGRMITERHIALIIEKGLLPIFFLAFLS